MEVAAQAIFRFGVQRRLIVFAELMLFECIIFLCIRAMQVKVFASCNDPWLSFRVFFHGRPV